MGWQILTHNTYVNLDNQWFDHDCNINTILYYFHPLKAIKENQLADISGKLEIKRVSIMIDEISIERTKQMGKGSTRTLGRYNTLFKT